MIGRHGKRPLFTWAEAGWCPSDAINAIASDSDWLFGVLSSSIHERWAREQSSTLEDRLRYTPKTAFWTFPLPEKGDLAADVEQAARDVVAERGAACTKLIAQGKKQCGLTAVYNLMDEGGFGALAGAHHRLDNLVCRSYGWHNTVLNDQGQTVDNLYALNARRHLT